MQENNKNQPDKSNYTHENPETDNGRNSTADPSNNWEELGLDKTNIEGATISGAGSGPGTGDPDTSAGAGSAIAAVMDENTEAGSAILGTDKEAPDDASSDTRSQQKIRNFTIRIPSTGAGKGNTQE